MLAKSLLGFALLGAEWVLWLLVGLSVACLAVTIERAINAALNRTPEGAIRQSLSELMAAGSIDDFAGSMKTLRGMEARVLRAGASMAQKGVKSVEDAIIAATAQERIRLERGLVILGTVGSNAPFLGLFGTVLGIIKAFHDLAQNQAEAASAVMAGISEALVATAIGLMVAIPAVVLYNVFQRYNRNVLTRMDAFCHVLLACLSGSADRPVPAE
jgi:biopolymer transport protein ExbB